VNEAHMRVNELLSELLHESRMAEVKTATSGLQVQHITIIHHHAKLSAISGNSCNSASKLSGYDGLGYCQHNNCY